MGVAKLVSVNGAVSPQSASTVPGALFFTSAAVSSIPMRHNLEAEIIASDPAAMRAFLAWAASVARDRARVSRSTSNPRSS